MTGIAEKQRTRTIIFNIITTRVLLLLNRRNIALPTDDGDERFDFYLHNVYHGIIISFEKSAVSVILNNSYILVNVSVHAWCIITNGCANSIVSRHGKCLRDAFVNILNRTQNVRLIMLYISVKAGNDNSGFL